MDELRDNISRGKFGVDLDLALTFECVDFLKDCLTFIERERPSIELLSTHNFVKNWHDSDAKVDKYLLE